MTQSTLFDQPVTLDIPSLSYSPIASGAGTFMLYARETVNRIRMATSPPC